MPRGRRAGAWWAELFEKVVASECLVGGLDVRTVLQLRQVNRALRNSIAAHVRALRATQYTRISDAIVANTLASLTALTTLNLTGCRDVTDRGLAACLGAPHCPHIP
ncbi:hypothetical protein CYMTET_55795 [Cymbomonas tetramitiformis]|uniref:Receptor-type protein kinase n=1 Tax=Cymbomonas tetramitiformis TaxID=36881 RepID=A0AAE0BDM9_9CHLO|nr:hypothetical protein CYMTET_55795 [Cymbomonas tetramitiformis]